MNQTSSYYFKFDELTTPPDICQNKTLIVECDIITVNGLIIHSPELLPCCLMALILGMTLAHKVLKMKSQNYKFYAITFAMIGVMMTDAGLTDCILPDLFPKKILMHYYYALI